MEYLFILVIGLLSPQHVIATTTPYEVKEEIKQEERLLTIEEKIAAVFPEDPLVAVKVGIKESTLNPKAYNPEWHYDRYGNKICQGSYGVMQVACVHYLENPSALFGVDLNLAIAKKIYLKRGWKPWGVCTNGKVNCGI